MFDAASVIPFEWRSGVTPLLQTFDHFDVGEQLEAEFRRGFGDLSSENVYERHDSYTRRKWQATRNFGKPEINYRLGQMVDGILPEDVKQSLQRLSLGLFPHVLVLHGMPTGKDGYGLPEDGIPL